MSRDVIFVCHVVRHAMQNVKISQKHVAARVDVK